MTGTIHNIFKTLNEVKTQCDQVKNGKRGWIGLTKISQESGVSKATLQELCEKQGLKTKNHGRNGLVALS